MLRRYHSQTLSVRNDKRTCDILRDKINVYSRHKQSFGRFYALSGCFFMVRQKTGAPTRKTQGYLRLNASTFYLKRNYVLLQTQVRSVQNARAFSEAFRRDVKRGKLDGLSGLAGIFINCIYAGCGNKSVVLVSTPVYRKLEKTVTTRQPVKRRPGKGTVFTSVLHLSYEDFGCVVLI